MTLGGSGSGWGSGGGWGSDGGWGQPAGDPSDDRSGDEHGVPSDQPDAGRSPRLAPLPVASLLEVAGRIIRRNVGPLLAAAALFQLPSSLADAAAQQRLGRALAPLVVGLDTDTPRVLSPTSEQAHAILESLLLLAGTSIVGALLGALATLAFTAAVLDDYHGRRPTLGGMVRTAIGRALPALGAALLASIALLAVVVGAVVLAAAALTLLPASDGGVGGPGAFLAILVGVSAVVVAVVVMVRLALSAAVLAAEPGGAIRALRRSWHLTGDNTWRAFAVLGIVAMVLTIVGSTLLELAAVIITDGLAAGVGLADVSDALLAALVSTLLAPIGGVVLGVLYLDLRVRRDGWQPTLSDEAAKG